jgi:hypothetical protein
MFLNRSRAERLRSWRSWLLLDPGGFQNREFSAKLDAMGQDSKENIEDVLKGLPDAKRQEIVASLGTLRAFSRSDIEAALRHDRLWLLGLPPWRRWVAARIIALTEYLLRRRLP